MKRCSLVVFAAVALVASCALASPDEWELNRRNAHRTQKPSSSFSGRRSSPRTSPLPPPTVREAIGVPENLLVTKPDDLAMLDSATLICKAPVGQPENGCTFITPQGNYYNVDGVTVTEGVTPVDGYTPYTDLDDATTCGIIIEEVMDRDLGDWRCVIERDYSVDPRPDLVGVINLRLASDDAIPDFRIPRDVTPSNYDITLATQILAGGTVQGRWKMTGTVEKGTYVIHLNANGLNIDEQSVTVFVNSEVTARTIVRHGYDFERNFYFVELSTPISTRGSTVVISGYHSTTLSPEGAGFYYDSYTTEGTGGPFGGSDVIPHGLVVTQFESSGARTAFPCMDEPDIKATFDIAIGKPDDTAYVNHVALSNAEELNNNVDEPDFPDFVFTTFETTPLMSTYLVAFAISDLSQVTVPGTVDDHGVVHTIWTRPERVNDAAFAKGWLADNLAYLEGLLQFSNVNPFFEDELDYPLGKLDTFVAPSKQGAMENWGLMTYGEAFILYDEDVDGPFGKELAASVTPHELVHVWFGDFVTMDWWSRLWLNEGFATFISDYYAVDHSNDEVRQKDRFTIEEMHGVMELDAYPDTHPMDDEIENPEGTENGDNIAYDKGASILRMLHDQIVGENAFMTPGYTGGGRGSVAPSNSIIARCVVALPAALECCVRTDLASLTARLLGGKQGQFHLTAVLTAVKWKWWNQNYLLALKYDNAEQDDLWHYLNEEANLNDGLHVKTIMDTWTQQSGYPVVTVTSDGADGFVLNQTRFYAEGAAATVTGDCDADEDATWYIPISYTTVGEGSDFDTTAYDFMMSQRVMNYTPFFDSFDASQPYVFNVKQSGFYRVNYDEDNWNDLIDELKADLTSIHLHSRIQLIDDAFSLAHAGMLDYTTAFELTSYLAEGEEEEMPFYAAGVHLKRIGDKLRFSNSLDSFREYVDDITTYNVERLNIEPASTQVSEPFIDSYMRLEVLPLACTYGDSQLCQELSGAQLANWMSIQPTQDSPFYSFLRPDTYCAAVKDQGDDGWDFMAEYYRANRGSDDFVGDEENAVIGALSCVEDSSDLNDLLDLTLTDDDFRANVVKFAALVAANPVGKDIIWDWLEDSYQALGNNAEDVLVAVAASYGAYAYEPSDLELLQDVIVTYSDQLSSTAVSALRLAERSVVTNEAWYARYYEPVSAYLSPSATATTAGAGDLSGGIFNLLVAVVAMVVTAPIL